MRFLEWLDALYKALLKKEPIVPIPPSLMPTPIPSPPPAPAPVIPLFDTPQHAYHSTRVIADDIGLTFEQKEVLCACIYQESTFLNYRSPGVPVTNGNKDKTGKVWSTDWGICQVNDYFHIGPGKDFASVACVMGHPEKVVAWMARIYKSTGALTPWASYTSGAYKPWLKPGSPMRKLSTPLVG